jgi:UDP-N-acetylglucosamine 2-epimerase
MEGGGADFGAGVDSLLPQHHILEYRHPEAFILTNSGSMQVELVVTPEIFIVVFHETE